MTLLAAGVAGYALSSALVPGLRTPFVQALFDQKTLRAFGHLLGGGTSILAGAFQFNATLRNRRPAVHRLLGRIYLVAVAVSGVSALMLAPTSSGGMTAQVGFGLLAVGWLVTSGVAYRQVRAGEYELHRQWMMRSYALCLAAVTLRLYLAPSLAMGVAFSVVYPIVAWLCWVPNLLVAEWLIAARRTRAAVQATA